MSNKYSTKSPEHEQDPKQEQSEEDLYSEGKVLYKNGGATAVRVSFSKGNNTYILWDGKKRTIHCQSHLLSL